MNRFRFLVVVLAALILGQGVLRAEDPDETYLDILTLVKQADALNTSGKSLEALRKYQRAQFALKTFQKNHPDWKPKIMAFRTAYLEQKVDQLSKTNAVAAKTNTPAAPKPAAPAHTNAAPAQTNAPAAAEDTNTPAAPEPAPTAPNTPPAPK